jgi:hypothetical protein
MNKERVVIWEKERQYNTWQHGINLVAYLMTKQQANMSWAGDENQEENRQPADLFKYTAAG